MKQRPYQKRGRRLAAARKRLGWTQARVAERMDVTVVHISRIEGGGGASMRLLERLAKLYGTTLGEVTK